MSNIMDNDLKKAFINHLDAKLGKSEDPDKLFNLISEYSASTLQPLVKLYGWILDTDIGDKDLLVGRLESIKEFYK